jgi:hypothetical protein
MNKSTLNCLLVLALLFAQTFSLSYNEGQPRIKHSFNQISREESLYKAKIAQIAERYEDMAEAMTK